jgi:hypothetical protein
MSEFIPQGPPETQFEQLAKFMANGAEVDWLVIEPILAACGKRLMDLMQVSAFYRGTNAN